MHAIPLSLLELTLLRLSFPLSSRTIPKRVFTSRYRHQATLATAPPPAPHHHLDAAKRKIPKDLKHDGLSSSNRENLPSSSSSSLPSEYSPHPALDELHRRVESLEKAAATAEMSSPMEDEYSSFTEEELSFFYQDVLTLQPPETAAAATREELKRVEIENDKASIDVMEKRLLLVSPFTDAPAARPRWEERREKYLRILEHVRNQLDRMEVARESFKLTATAGVEESASSSAVPLTFLTIAEYQSLCRTSVRARNLDAAKLTLDLMKKSGLEIPDGMTVELMASYAYAGDVIGVENVIRDYLKDFPTSQHRHLHVKAHLISTPPNTLPTTALQVLHSYETQKHPAPMQTYTSVITSLFSTDSSLGRAQAWDVFTHMRYVAHPDPDVHLYTLMIRGCASSRRRGRSSSEPEKALDFWAEMTVDRKMDPTPGAYDAVILACARSGDKTYVNEAFRLAKQMLDAHRDARGVSAFRPSQKTFCALLEGAKRIGDLTRARWILAQMIKDQNEKDKEEAVNEEAMMHVFHAYAAYKPPVHCNALHATSSTTQRSNPAAIPPSSIPDEAYSRPAPSFTHIPPQTHAEAIREAQLLWDRILYDSGLKSLPDPTESGALPSQLKFKHVELTPRLLNSYLSVHYRHSSLETARDLYWYLFDESNRVHRTSRTYVEALERCAIARRGHERTVALEFAEQVWAQWQRVEEVGMEESGRELSGRMIEKAHVAMIRILSLSNHTERAMQLLRAFATRYPPVEIRSATPRPPLMSTRTALEGERPLVRMTTPVEIPDDYVPPLIMFNDVEILHHRLVVRGAKSDIAYLSWLCKSYEGSLRMRRDATLKANAKETPSLNPENPKRLSSPRL